MEDNKKDASISYFVLEGILNHYSMIIKRLIATIIVLVFMIGAIIAGFLWYLSLPVEEYDTVTVENEEGNANYIGADMNGDFNYGESN